MSHSLSLIFSLPLVIHPSPSLSLLLFVLMNQCFSEHSHYGFDSQGSFSIPGIGGKWGRKTENKERETKNGVWGVKERNGKKGEKE